MKTYEDRDQALPWFDQCAFTHSGSAGTWVCVEKYNHAPDHHYMVKSDRVRAHSV